MVTDPTAPAILLGFAGSDPQFSDGGVTYTYDAAENRTMKTENGATITYTLGIGDRLASWTGGAYTYDVAGNVTRIEREGRPALDLTWNSQYQLVSVATNGVFAESYAYDALGRRVSTTKLEGTTRHVYDDNWQVVADVGTNGNVIASYVWGDGIDWLLAVKIGGASYYPLTDIQGTIWGYVDSQNNVVARWQYDAWGNVVDEDVSAPALAKLRYRFQCREWSAATGLVNFRMRWYDPETGRWLSKDPIRLSGGLNLYAFCSTSPINLCDIFGLCTTDDKNKSPFMTAGSVLIVTGGIIIAGVSNAAPPGPVGAAVVAGGWVVGGLMEAAGFVSTIIGVSRGERGPNWPKK
jgi:RHS repeat-associated protein